jgi:hypothetical protein
MNPDNFCKLKVENKELCPDAKAFTSGLTESRYCESCGPDCDLVGSTCLPKYSVNILKQQLQTPGSSVSSGSNIMNPTPAPVDTKSSDESSFEVIFNPMITDNMSLEEKTYVCMNLNDDSRTNDCPDARYVEGQGCYCGDVDCKRNKTGGCTKAQFGTPLPEISKCDCSLSACRLISSDLETNNNGPCDFGRFKCITNYGSMNYSCPSNYVPDETYETGNKIRNKGLCVNGPKVPMDESACINDGGSFENGKCYVPGQCNDGTLVQLCSNKEQDSKYFNTQCTISVDGSTLKCSQKNPFDRDCNKLSETFMNIYSYEITYVHIIMIIVVLFLFYLFVKNYKFNYDKMMNALKIMVRNLTKFHFN